VTVQKVLFSKCDRCGDQVFFYNTFLKSLLNSDRIVIYITNKHNSFFSSLVSSFAEFSYISKIPLIENINSFRQKLKKNRHIILYCPFNPQTSNEKILSDDACNSNWVSFLRKISVDVAVCGTINPTWVDRLNCLSVVSDIAYFGLQNGKNLQNIPSQFDKFQNNSNEDITNIANDIEYPEQLFFNKILSILEVQKPQLSKPHKVESGLIAFFVGSSSDQRKISLDLMYEIAEDFSQKFNLKVIFVYGPNEEVLFCNKSKYKNVEHLIFRGQDFQQLMELLKQIKLAFTHETFYYHLLNHFGIPHVMVAGGGHWKRFFYENVISTVITNRLPCFNCDWNCIYDNSYCISEIKKSSIIHALEQRFLSPVIGFRVYASNNIIEILDYTKYYFREGVSNNYIDQENQKILKLLSRINEEKNLITHKYSGLLKQNMNLWLHDNKSKRLIDLYTKLIENNLS
jgi:hypothetical protein